MNEGELLTIGEVAAMIGLSPHTIRTWERRYGLLGPRRSLSNQRRYSPAEVETLKRVKQIRDRRGGSLRLAVQEAAGVRESAPRPEITSSRRWRGEGAAENLWRSAADFFLGPVAIVGPRGCILDCNLAFARLVGHDREELQGGRFADLVDPVDRLKATRFYRRPLTQRQGWELTVRVREGAPLTLSFEGTPARYGQTAALVCRASPISPRSTR